MQFVTYNIVGIVNTVVGFSIIFLLMFSGMTAVMSNMIGYMLGGILSYYLNKKYTFKSKEDSILQALKFFMVIFLAYGLNFLVLQWLLKSINPYMAQFFAAVVYTLSSFILAKFVVFKGKI